MKKRNLAGALALVFAVHPAFAIERSHDGSGQAVLLPYYSVENGLSTVFAVSNHADEPKAVRVVIAEGRNGRVALSYNVYLAARDTWSGAIVADQGSPPAPPRVLTIDTSCTSGTFPPEGVSMRELDFFGTRADGLGIGVDRLTKGQIELIELGTLTGSAAALAQAKDCGALRSRFEPGGAWAANINADIAAPTGRLSGEAQLIEVERGVAFSTEPFSINGFSNAARHSNGSTDYEDVRIYKPTSVNGNNEFVVDGNARISGQRPADAVSLMLMAAELEGGFTISDDVDASTHFVLSFPTRAAYLDDLGGGELPAGTAPIAPFAGVDVAAGGPYCVQTTWSSIDRDGDRGAFTEVPLCEQVNVIQVVGEMDTTNHFDSSFRTTIDQGRLRVGLHAELHTLTYSAGPGNGNGFLRGLPAVAHSLMEVRNTNAQPGLLASYAISGAIVRKQDGAVAF